MLLHKNKQHGIGSSTSKSVLKFCEFTEEIVSSSIWRKTFFQCANDLCYQRIETNYIACSFGVPSVDYSALSMRFTYECANVLHWKEDLQLEHNHKRKMRNIKLTIGIYFIICTQYTEALLSLGAWQSIHWVMIFSDSVLEIPMATPAFETFKHNIY